MIINIETAVITALKNISGAWGTRVFRVYPNSFAILPVVSVYSLIQNDINSGDGKGLKVFNNTLNIDVWTKDRVDAIRASVKQAMYGLNTYVRQSGYRELQEDNGIMHLIFQYEVIGG